MICRLFSVLSHYLNQWCLYLGTNFNKVLIEIHKFSYRKIHLYMSSATRHLFSFSLNVLTGPFGKISMKSELKSNIHTWRSSWKSLLYVITQSPANTTTLIKLNESARIHPCNWVVTKIHFNNQALHIVGLEQDRMISIVAARQILQFCTTACILDFTDYMYIAVSHWHNLSYLAQDRGISIAKALKIPLSCSKPPSLFRRSNKVSKQRDW